MDIIQLPKKTLDPKETENLCKCRPICKSRRRKWKGETQKTSAELLLERKPVPECFRRWPSKIIPNGPCPIFGRTRRFVIRERGVFLPPSNVAKICQAPVDTSADVTYLKYADIAKSLGAWTAVRARCAFCDCCKCCSCDPHGYTLDEEKPVRRRRDMKEFDTRVKTDYKTIRIMYDLP